jgi:hypothetical protein
VRRGESFLGETGVYGFVHSDKVRMSFICVWNEACMHFHSPVIP